MVLKIILYFGLNLLVMAGLLIVCFMTCFFLGLITEAIETWVKGIIGEKNVDSEQE